MIEWIESPESLKQKKKNTNKVMDLLQEQVDEAFLSVVKRLKSASSSPIIQSAQSTDASYEVVGASSPITESEGQKNDSDAEIVNLDLYGFDGASLEFRSPWITWREAKEIDPVLLEEWKMIPFSTSVKYAGEKIGSISGFVTETSIVINNIGVKQEPSYKGVGSVALKWFADQAKKENVLLVAKLRRM